MSAPTGDPRVVAQMNDLLGQELGRNEYGEPIFSWRWSEGMFWPAARTGRTVTTETKVLIPMIGAPAETHDFDLIGDTCSVCGKPEIDLAHNVYSISQATTPEYGRDRQVRKQDTWFIAKWLSPWELITGPRSGHIRHGDSQSDEKSPSTEAIIAAWSSMYPGMDFPARGWRIPTSACLPRGPHDLRTPNRADTADFIQQVRFQVSGNFDALLQGWHDADDEKNRREETLIGDECRDAFGAFLNPTPGKRSSFVSMPWTRFDRQR